MRIAFSVENKISFCVLWSTEGKGKSHQDVYKWDREKGEIRKEFERRGINSPCLLLCL